MSDCSPFDSPHTPPAGTGTDSVSADRRQYLHRVASTDYNTVRGVLNASDRKRPMWMVRAWAYSITQITAVAPPPPADPAAILGGRTSAPLQLEIGYATGSVASRLRFDLAGSALLAIPPSTSLSVSVITPSDSAEVSVDGGRLIDSGLQATGGAFIQSIVGVAAWPMPVDYRESCDQDGRRVRERVSASSPFNGTRNRLTLLLNVPGGAGALTIAIPAGAHTVTLLDGPQVAAGAPPSPTYQFVGAFDPTGAQTFPIGRLPRNTPLPIAGLATQIEVRADPVNSARVSAVFEVE